MKQKEPSYTVVNKFEIKESMGSADIALTWKDGDRGYKIARYRRGVSDGTRIILDVSTHNEEIIKKVKELYELIKKQNE